MVFSFYFCFRWCKYGGNRNNVLFSILLVYNKNPNFISLLLDRKKKARLLLPHTEKRQTYARHFTICFHIEYQNRNARVASHWMFKCDVPIAMSFGFFLVFFGFFFLKKLGIFMTKNKTIKMFVIFSTKCKFTSIKEEAVNSRWKVFFLLFYFWVVGVNLSEFIVTY